jgi:N-glycosylase/DNA lyase
MIKMEKIRAEYEIKKKEIRQRLSDFKRFYSEPVCWHYENNTMILKESSKDFNERIFEELVFCILTANGSAASAMKAVDQTRDLLMTGTAEEIQTRLKESGVRFHNRASYIVETREKLKKEYDFNIRGILESIDEPKQLREFFIGNIKGFGYKEASHFLRNIGIFGLAILDKHILRTLYEYKMIEEVPKTLTRKRYLHYGERLFEFARKLDINPDELDLLLWSMKNGKIMK